MIYEEFIKKLNSNNIKCFRFRLKGYPHYNNCMIYRQIDEIANGKQLSIIVCKLTNDDYEKVSFYKNFDESYKLFSMGRKGRFTLKQIWGLIDIIEII